MTDVKAHFCVQCNTVRHVGHTCFVNFDNTLKQFEYEMGPQQTPTPPKASEGEPKIGYMITESHAEDYSFWDGVITYPNPKGSNLAWENPTAMIEKSAYDALCAKNQELREKLKAKDELLKECLEELEFEGLMSVDIVKQRITKHLGDKDG